MEAAAFFDYYCTRCDTPYCERVNIMNLALDYTEEGFCLSCLAQAHEMREPELAAFILDYVNSRECFQTPWNTFDPAPCPKNETKTCYCQPGSTP